MTVAPKQGEPPDRLLSEGSSTALRNAIVGRQGSVSARRYVKRYACRMRRSPWIRRAGFVLLSSGLFFVPGDLLLPPSDAPAFAVVGVVAALIGAPLVLRREEDSPVAAPVPASTVDARERERVLFLAIHVLMVALSGFAGRMREMITGAAGREERA